MQQRPLTDVDRDELRQFMERKRSRDMFNDLASEYARGFCAGVDAQREGRADVVEFLR